MNAFITKIRAWINENPGDIAICAGGFAIGCGVGGILPLITISTGAVLTLLGLGAQVFSYKV